MYQDRQFTHFRAWPVHMCTSLVCGTSNLWIPHSTYWKFWIATRTSARDWWQRHFCVVMRAARAAGGRGVRDRSTYISRYNWPSSTCMHTTGYSGSENNMQWALTPCTASCDSWPPNGCLAQLSTIDWHFFPFN